MYWQKCGFFFNVIVSLALNCSLMSPSSEKKEEEFRFGVINVGQGLSQVGIINKNAVVWDVGPPEGYNEWLNVYNNAGKPYISILIISHSDRDHAGALAMITEDINWSGKLGIHAYEDTGLIKKKLILWKKPVELKIIGQNDTILLNENIEIKCLWPPSGLTLGDSQKDPNQYSLAFRVEHNFNHVLITSDVDSANLENITQTYRNNLKSEVFVVPHHGSEKSYNFSFLGYVAPDYAVISHGVNNYGHPSTLIISLLLSFDCEVLFTATDNTCFFKSNGLYWTKNW